VISDFVYFEVDLMSTLSFDKQYQAYNVEYMNPSFFKYYSYNSIVDYNVFHIKTTADGNMYIPVKYDIDDLLEEHLHFYNPIIC